jgi:hypothetical protein
MGIPVRYLLQAESRNAPWGDHAVLLGTGELDQADAVQRGDGLWVLRQVPDHLHLLAEQLESGMTTGPDPTTWLGPGCCAAGDQAFPHPCPWHAS